MQTTTEMPKKPRKNTKKASEIAKAIEVAHEVPQPTPDGELGKAARAIRGKRKPPPTSDAVAARGQLRRIVAQYEDLTDQIKRTKQRTGDYHDRDTGEIINACSLSPEQVGVLNEVADSLEKAKAQIEREMARLLAAFPVYTVWLKDVAGVGVVTAAKLLADVDIRRCEKISALHRVCGLAVRVDADGKVKAQRATAGVAIDFHGRLKVGLFQAWSSLVKMAKREESPYYRRGMQYKHRLLTSPRFVEHPTKKDSTGKPAATFDGRPGGRAIVNNMAWRPAMQLFLEHLYIVWRTLEGLPVWPSYEAAKLGYAHGGKIAVNAPKMLTIAEALAAVESKP